MEGNATCNHLIRYEDNNVAADYNRILHAYPLMRKKRKLSENTTSLRYHNVHHEKTEVPINAGNLSKAVLEAVQKYYWEDMCLFNYDTSLKPT